MLSALVLAAAVLVNPLLEAGNVGGTPMVELKPYAVTLSVAKIDSTARWYQDVLGFELVDSKSYPEFGTRLVFLKRGEFRVELIEDGRAKPAAERADPPAHTAILGVSQFAFRVDDIDATQRALAARGAKFAWELQRYPDLKVAFLFVRDPERNLIQFIQRLD